MPTAPGFWSAAVESVVFRPKAAGSAAPFIQTLPVGSWSLNLSPAAGC